MALPGAAEIEPATLSVWPALQVAHDRLWLWRGARGYTKRANAIHCLDPSDGADADARLGAMIELSRLHDLPPIFRVTPLTAPEAIAATDRLQWESFDTSLVLAMTMPATDWPVARRTEQFAVDDPAWYLPQAKMSGASPERLAVFKAILSVIVPEARGIIAYYDDNVPAAAALVGVANGIGVYLNVVARPTARRQGFGRAVMSAALNWSHDAGANYAAIQVLASNKRALGLYESLGFQAVYDYHYRTPAEYLPK